MKMKIKFIEKIELLNDNLIVCSKNHHLFTNSIVFIKMLSRYGNNYEMVKVTLESSS